MISDSLAPHSSARDGFAEGWRDLSFRLRPRLSRLGISGELQQDVLQETAVRILERWDRIDHDRDLTPLAWTIARNLAVDQFRVDARTSPLEETWTSNDETEQAVLARVTLQRTWRAIARMRTRDRHLLVAAALGDRDEVSTSATKVARMRARRRLVTMLSRLPAVCPIRFRELPARIGRRARADRLASIPLLGEALVALVIVAIGLDGSGVAVDARPSSGAELSLRSQAWSINTLQSAGGGERGRIGGGNRPDAEGQPDAARQARDRVALLSGGIPAAGSKGEHRDRIGLGGYELEQEGEVSAGDQTIGWRGRHDYRTPRCVRRLGGGQVSTDCTGGSTPRGRMRIDVGDRSYVIRY